VSFSFVLRRNGSWRLAPGYDITFAHNPAGAWTNQHLMAVNGRFQGISRDEFLADAERFRIGSPGPIIDRVKSAVKEWMTFAAMAGVPEEGARDIGAQHILL
jgi:serine/threonine-protein kinase HipA